ncbi:hypothetical protein TNCV_2782381 [Trichonephila clavipes]|nr:hypothetical protein TNCV_2782381 [Trichonephila clavipes]
MRSQSSSFESVGQVSRGSLEPSTVCHEGDPVRSPRCRSRRRSEDANINTPVAVKKRTVNYLEGTLWSFTTMWTTYPSSCADVTFRHTLHVFQILRCSSVHCF